MEKAKQRRNSRDLSAIQLDLLSAQESSVWADKNGDMGAKA
jgi:hypothetical protein